MQVALAHDYFYALGGAEQTVAVMHGLWPEAPVYTSFVDHATFPLILHRLGTAHVVSPARAPPRPIPEVSYAALPARIPQL